MYPFFQKQYLRKHTSTIENTGKVNFTKQLVLSSVVIPALFEEKAGYFDTRTHRTFIRPAGQPYVRTSVCNVTSLLLDHLT